VHPFLLQRRWLLAYLAVWVPLAAIPTAVLAHGGGADLARAAALTLGPTLLFALLTLPTWYLCRAVRPGWSTLPRVLGAHGLAALGAGASWLVLLQVAARLASLLPGYADAPVRLDARLPGMAGVGVLFYALVAAFHYLLASLEAARDADARAAKLAMKAREAELASLRARVQPHFLFNSLNTIHALVPRDPALARQVCLGLADFLRASLRTLDGRDIPLVDELALARSYLAVEQVRLGARLVVREVIDPDAEACPVPPLVLQPLIEYAIGHGIAGLEHGGTLTVEAHRGPAGLTLRVTNPFDPQAPARPGTGHGLRSVRERLAIAHGDDASFEVRRDGGLFEATLRLPLAEPPGRSA